MLFIVIDEWLWDEIIGMILMIMDFFIVFLLLICGVSVIEFDVVLVVSICV